MTLEEAHAAISDMLIEAERFFKPDVVLSFIMRRPDNEECEMLVTEDSLDELAALIARMKEREARSGD